MNAFLWILQTVLALLSLAGGVYKAFAYEELAKLPATAMFPRSAWGALGAFEMICAVLLVAPFAAKWRLGLTPIAAGALALESLVLAGVDARYSLELTAANPLIWVALMTLMASTIALGRFAWISPSR